MTKKFSEYKQLDLFEINNEMKDLWAKEDKEYRNPRRLQAFHLLRRSAIGKRNAWYPPCYGSYNQGCSMPLQDFDWSQS